MLWSERMTKEIWKPGNMLYPLPVVMVSMADRAGNYNIITIAWAGTVCTNPPMVSISVRPDRYSFPILKETGEFVVNLTTKELAYATDFCGVKSGREVDKFKALGLTPLAAEKVHAPLIGESPVNIECRVRQVMGFRFTRMSGIWTKRENFTWRRQNPSSIPMALILRAEKSWAGLGTA